MENTSNTGNLDIDPAADLALLDRAKRTVEVNDLTDFGPWWYAPLLATFVATLTLFKRGGTDVWDVVYFVAGMTAVVIAVTHNYRRQRVRAKLSREGFWGTAGLAFLGFVAVVGWGIAVSTMGYDDFVPAWAAVAWFLTMGFFLVIREVSRRTRARQLAFA